MDLITAVLSVAGFFAIWITLNAAISELTKKPKVDEYFPHEYYKADKGWWKKW